MNWNKIILWTVVYGVIGYYLGNALLSSYKQRQPIMQKVPVSVDIDTFFTRNDTLIVELDTTYKMQPMESSNGFISDATQDDVDWLLGKLSEYWGILFVPAVQLYFEYRRRKERKTNTKT